MMIDVKLEESRMGEDDGLTGEDLTTSSLKSSRSANESSDDCVDRVPFGAVPPFVRGGVWKHYHASPRLLTCRGKEVCIEALHLLILVMEPKNRWKLYLLLRMMSKVSANEKLQLDEVITNRALLRKRSCGMYCWALRRTNKRRCYLAVWPLSSWIITPLHSLHRNR